VENFNIGNARKFSSGAKYTVEVTGVCIALTVGCYWAAV